MIERVAGMSKYIGALENEVFIGNDDSEAGVPDYLVPAGLKTLRIGDKALDLDGNELPGFRPIFIDRGELAAYNRYMHQRAFPNEPWRGA